MYDLHINYIKNVKFFTLIVKKMCNFYIMELKMFKNSKDKFESFLIRAYEVAEVSNMKQLSNFLGVSYDLFRKKDINVFAYEKLEVLADRKNVNIKWLMSGEGAKYKNQFEIDSHIHKFFALSIQISQKFTDFQTALIQATDPDSEGGMAITETERKQIRFVLEELFLKLKQTSELAGIELDCKIQKD